ncbi:nucleotide-binding domain-containing protein [Escherichia coli]
MIRDKSFRTAATVQRKRPPTSAGDHVVECYVIKNEVVVARAQIEFPIN